MALTIRLLGPPAIARDGVPAPPPRGRKAWALLAYLLLADRPPSRRHLAELLFGDADDPLGALRWTLAELRRALGTRELFGGDPVATALGGGVEVDLEVLAGQPADPTALAAARLLAGGIDNPAFARLLDGRTGRLERPRTLGAGSGGVSGRGRSSLFAGAPLRAEAAAGDPLLPGRLGLGEQFGLAGPRHLVGQRQHARPPPSSKTFVHHQNHGIPKAISRCQR